MERGLCEINGPACLACAQLFFLLGFTPSDRNAVAGFIDEPSSYATLEEWDLQHDRARVDARGRAQAGGGESRRGIDQAAGRRPTSFDVEATRDGRLSVCTLIVIVSRSTTWPGSRLHSQSRDAPPFVHFFHQRREQRCGV